MRIKAFENIKFCCFCRIQLPQNYWMCFSTCEAPPQIKQLSWNSRLLFTFKQDFSLCSVCLLCTGICATVEKLKGHVDWLSTQNARQPDFPSSWLCELKFKETIVFFLKQKTKHITPWPGFVNQSCRSPGCEALSFTSPDCLGVCVFLFLCRCKSMLGHTSAHRAVCIHAWQTRLCT